MSSTMNKIVLAIVVVGLCGAMSALGGDRAETAPPVVAQAAKAADMCTIADSFSATPAMAREIRLAAGCR